MTPNCTVNEGAGNGKIFTDDVKIIDGFSLKRSLIKKSGSRELLVVWLLFVKNDSNGQRYACLVDVRIKYGVSFASWRYHYKQD